MTASVEASVVDDPSDAEGDAKSAARAARRAERIRLVVQPALVLVLVVVTLVYALTRDLTATQAATINVATISQRVLEHVLITFVVTALVVLIAVPLGIILTRNGYRRLAPVFIGIANIGQAAPAVGLLVLLFLATGSTGFWVGVLPIAFYSLLPVLRNTMLGFQQVDASYIDAARGQGMSGSGILWRIEFPLAVPYILAGLRTSLVLAVGTATLSFLVGAGGLGVLIDTGYKLNQPLILVVGAVLAVALALLVDWLGALAEAFLGPKGLR
ncbi:ABC transporter permease [Rhodococcus sp. SORGH_AS_0303]|uniref:ABC transporter permease n=1 Tax=Rhodococcus sp. SORGH_AS_0303 TaxID=3041753 RepID=UPI00277D7D7C|nr:osmoprotectant transport system permease protein [Rhodococcus sp. SORGH_AS_0303]